MAAFSCPHCQVVVQRLSPTEHEARCGNCGGAILFPADEPSVVQVAPVDDRSTSKERSSLGCLVVLLLVLACGVFFVAETPSDRFSSPPVAPKQKKDLHTEAWIRATIHVEDRLKSPGTATFGHLEKQVESIGDYYAVRGWVDSQNGFGATVRTNFYCRLKHVSGDKWQLEEIEFKPR